MLTYIDVPFKSITLKTDSEPYRVTVNYHINNFKTNYRTFYLFAFDGEKLIAYADLKTADAEQNAITAFLALQGIRR